MILTQFLSVLSIASLFLSTSIGAKESNIQPSTTQQITNNSNIASNTLQPQIIQIAKPVNFKAIIADQHTLKNSLIANYESVNNKKIIIQQAEASFIKVHFNQLTIPVGSYIEVKNFDGSQVHRYGNSTPSLYTLQDGDDGINSFSSLSIIGDVAIIELITPTNSLTTQLGAQQYQIEIDSFMQGMSESEIELAMLNQPSFDEAFAVNPHSSCGSTERPDVQCWADTHPVEFERSRPVARLLINGSGLCTAWRVGADNRMFTNNHCISSATGPSKSEVWFNYQKSSCGSGSTSGTVIVTGDQLLSTSSDLDYTLFTLKNFDQIASFGHYGLDVRNPVEQERIYIPQHGRGLPKQLAIESDKNSDGLCRVDVVLADGSAPNTDMGYMCDTIGGSSGSPVLAASSNNVLALHHFGGCPNQGVLINRIWPEVTEHFNNQIPVGDNDPTDCTITASFNYTLNGLTVSFVDASNNCDNNQIMSYQWDFADGSTSSQKNPQHQFAAAGDYQVSMTITDSHGISYSNSQTISVAIDNNGQLNRGVAISDLSAASNEEIEFYFDVPDEANSVSFNIRGGSGDADLYVKFAAKPSQNDYDCRPYKSGNTENCIYNNAQQGRYYVMLKAYRAFSGVEIIADYTENVDGVSLNETNLAATTGNWQHFTLELPENMTELVSKISSGSGDADLYVNYAQEPTTSNYICRPYKGGNNETCTIANPQAGTWYFSIKAYSSYSGVNLSVEAN